MLTQLSSALSDSIVSLMISTMARESCEPQYFEDSMNFALFPEEDYHFDSFCDLLTPPQTPEHEWDCSKDISDYDISSTTTQHCRCSCPIVRDCMWSANLAVRIPDVNGRLNDKSGECETNFAQTSLSSTQTKVCSRCAGLDTTLQCVDTMSVFNCVPPPLPVVKSSSRLSPSLSSSSSSSCQQIKEETVEEEYFFSDFMTVCKREPTSDYDESYGSISSSDDDCEVDVESVSDTANDDPIPTKYIRLPTSKNVLVLPASTSASAQVAAMHNYSSALSPPSYSSHHSHARFVSSPGSAMSRCGVYGNSASAPQSPETCTAVSKSKRCAVSNPSSPSSRRDRHRREDRRCFSSDALSSRVKKRYQKRASMLPTPGSSDSEGDVNKRAQHNVLERKRRNNLKEYFSLLRDHIPTLKVEPRSSKVNILQRAKEWVDELSATERRHQSELHRQRSYRDELLKRIVAAQQRGLSH